MKRKFGSLFLAVTLMFSFVNLKPCFAYGYQYYETCFSSNAQKRKFEKEFERSLSELQKDEKIRELEKELKDEKIKALKAEIKQQKSEEKQKKSSLWASTKRVFKNCFSTGVGVLTGASATIAVLAIAAALFAGGSAAFECYNDDKCHFDDKSFFEKWNKETFKKSFFSLCNLLKECMKNVHFVVTPSHED